MILVTTITTALAFELNKERIRPLMELFQRKALPDIDYNGTCTMLNQLLVGQQGPTKLWIFEDNQTHEVHGYGVSQRVANGGRAECFIWQVAFNNHEAMKTGVKVIKDWAIEDRCATIYFSTRRKAAVMGRALRRFGFTEQKTIFSLKVQ